MKHVMSAMDPNRALQKAMHDQDFKTIKRILKNPGVDLDQRDESHGLQTILMRLCHLHLDSEKREEIFNLIMNRKPDVNIQDSSGRTALAHACIAEKLDIIQGLSLRHDCSPNIADNYGNSALTFTVRSGNVKVVQRFLESFRHHGIDMDHRNAKGKP